MSNLKQIQHNFERDGFVIVQELFQPDEAKKLKDECKFIIQKAKSNSQQPKQVANHGVYVGLAVGSSIFQKVITDARILDILEVILAPNIEFLSDKAVFKDEMINFASPKPLYKITYVPPKRILRVTLHSTSKVCRKWLQWSPETHCLSLRASFYYLLN